MAKDRRLRRVPLYEQIEELQQEWDRRNRAYPLMQAKGHIRHNAAEMKQGRLQAAINTLCWLEQHQQMIRSYMAYHERHLKLEQQVAQALEETSNDDQPTELPAAAE